jgi:DNA-binding transcriptional LysR family regulator
LAVIEHGSFNRAADALGVTQPAISKSINQLERALGTRLFDRGRGGASLTKSGRIVARIAANTEHLIGEARGELLMSEQGGLGPLVIGAKPSAALGLVPAACAHLSKQFGPLNIKIIEGMDADLLPALERGEINILVGPVSDLHPAPSKIEERVLLEERFLIGMAPGHSLSRHRSLRLRDLKDAAWVLPSPGSRFYQLVEAMFLSEAISWPGDSIVTNSLVAQEGIVAASDRILLLTDVQMIGRRAGLATVGLAGSPVRRFGWRCLRSMVKSPLMTRFVDALSTIAQGSQRAGYNP